MTGLKGKMTHFELLQSYVHAYPIMTKGWRVQMLTIVVIQKCVESYKNIIDSHYINQLWFILRVILLWHSMEAVAFFTPCPRPYFSLLALSCLVSSIERLSLHGSPNWKIMDLINWSLNAIDTIFSTRSLGSGEPVVLTGRSQPAIRWRVGEVANHVSSGSFRGGHWRYTYSEPW